MQKEEFESMLGKTVTQKEYDAIEYVYTNNAFFTNVNGKQQTVEFYKALGMGGFERLYHSTKETEIEIADLKAQSKRQSETISAYQEQLTTSLNAPLPAAALDALHYSVSALYRKRGTYLTAMATALDAGDRAEYNRANELDCALQERICAMERELPQS